MNENGKLPGQGAATGSLVCGIIAVVCWFFGVTTIGSLILGIIGLILASKAKKEGFSGGTRTAGFILSLIGVIVGAIVFIACVVVIGALGMASYGLY